MNCEPSDSADEIINLLADKINIVEEKNTPVTNVYRLNTSDIYEIIEYFLTFEDRPMEKPFYIINLNEVEKKVSLWKKLLPQITPYYAIKSNPDPMILSLLQKLGCGFDCASLNEINLAIATGVSREKIIYANPMKNPRTLKIARNKNIDILTFESKSEIDKIKLHHPEAFCILRIAVDDSKSECKFSERFGCTRDETRVLFDSAKGLNIVGVSFHVGSNCYGAGQYESAIKASRETFDIAKEYGYDMKILDIGGGFPGNNNEKFIVIANEINSAVQKYFSDMENLEIIAEPGRYICTTSHTLVVDVIGIKEKISPDGQSVYIYTINDSIYSSFNNIKYDHAAPIIIPHSEKDEIKQYKSIIGGRTCDGDDFIARDIMLPKLAVGEWVYIENMGAYTKASSSTFNGFDTPHVYYVITK